MFRTIQIAFFIWLALFLTSCEPASDNNFPKNLKIKDLAPINPDGSPEMRRLKTINLDLIVLEVPFDNFSKLDEIRRTLSVRPLKFNNYLAFSDNSFSAYYGKNKTLGTVYDLLTIAGAQQAKRMTVMLSDDDSDNVIIKQLSQVQNVSFTSMDREKETARIGPGYITLHINVEKANTLDQLAKVTMLPLFTVMSSNTIPQYNILESKRDFPFTSMALQLNMKPGDFIFLAPEKIPGNEDENSLSNIFFDNPYGTMF